MRFKIMTALAFGLLFTLDANAIVIFGEAGANHYASGDLRAAAVVGSENAYVKCEISGPYLTCQAADGFGKYGYCYTDEFRYKQLFPSLGKTATVVFFWDDTYRCVQVQVQNRSKAYGTRSPTAYHSEIAIGVDLSYRYAYGTTNAPHTAGEHMSCTAGTSGIRCDARDSNGVVATCTATRDSALQTLQDMTIAASGVSESSYVFFQWNDTPQKECTQLRVVNASYYMP